MSDSSVPRGHAADLFLAEWCFRAAGLVVILGALTMLLGGNGLGLLNGTRVLGHEFASPVMNERTELLGPAGEASVTRAQAQMGDLDQRSTAVSASGTGEDLAEVNGPVEATVTFWTPTGRQKWAWVLVRAVPAAAVGGILWLFAGLARSARRGDPFTRANVRRLTAITGLTVLAGVIGEWGGTFVRRWLIDSSDLGNLVPVDFTLSFAFVAVVLVMGLLTAVWRHGVAMRADLEGLV